MRRHSTIVIVSVLVLAAAPVAAAPAPHWGCKLSDGGKWELSVSGTMLSLWKGSKTGQPESYKILKEDSRIVEAAGPYGPGDKFAPSPSTLIWDRKSGELRLTAMDFSEDHRGICHPLNPN